MLSFFTYTLEGYKLTTSGILVINEKKRKEKRRMKRKGEQEREGKKAIDMIGSGMINTFGLGPLLRAFYIFILFWSQLDESVSLSCKGFTSVK